MTRFAELDVVEMVKTLIPNAPLDFVYKYETEEGDMFRVRLKTITINMEMVETWERLSLKGVVRFSLFSGRTFEVKEEIFRQALWNRFGL